MAFRGRYQHNLDSKGRLTVPARFRAPLSEGVVLCAGLDPCLSVFPSGAYERFSERFLAELNPLGSRARMLRRHFDGNAYDEEIDSAGRIRVPKELQSHASLSGECVIVGASDHFEIWDAKRWAKEDKRIREGVVEAAEALAGEDG